MTAGVGVSEMYCIWEYGLPDWNWLVAAYSGLRIAQWEEAFTIRARCDNCDLMRVQFPPSVFQVSMLPDGPADRNGDAG
jgi:hypothetical protein